MNKLTDTLKKTIADSGKFHLQIENECGVNRLSIGRFMRGLTSLSLEQAEMLAEYFGLELKPVKKVKQARTRKGT